jgi:cycloeucalenol cycloisomerase
MDIVLVMVLIFFAQLAVIGLLSFALKPYSVPGNFLPEPKGNESKHLYEVWALKYSVFWIGCFAVIIGFKLYATFDQNGYMYVCGGLALPLLLQPLLWPLGPREQAQSLTERYSFKANVWILIFSHIGNYW